MELRVEEYQLPEELKFNFEELKTELAEKVKKYELMTYTEEDLKAAKADRANLNKLKKILNDERIRRQKEYMQPFEEFKSKIDEIIRIIDKPVMLIDAQVKNYEEKKKEEKTEKINDLFTSKEFPEWLKISLIFDKSWLNASTSMKQIEDNLDGWKNRISAELKTIEGLQEFSFEATEVYKNTLDMAKAIAEGQRLADIQKRKKEAEEAAARMKAEADARRAEAEAKKQQEEAEKAGEKMAEGYAEGVEEKKPSGGAWIKFEAFLDIENAKKLRSFFESNGIEFRAV